MKKKELTKFSLLKRGEDVWWVEIVKRSGENRIYSGGLGYQYLLEGDEILEEAYAEDYCDLDFKKTSLYKYFLENSDNVNRQCGFIDRKGKFYRCMYHEHISLASYLFDKDEHELEELGWVKVSINEDNKPYAFSLNHEQEINWMTKEQIETLKQMQNLSNLYVVKIYEEILKKQEQKQ